MWLRTGHQSGLVRPPGLMCPRRAESSHPEARISSQFPQAWRFFADFPTLTPDGKPASQIGALPLAGRSPWPGLPRGTHAHEPLFLGTRVNTLVTSGERRAFSGEWRVASGEWHREWRMARSDGTSQPTGRHSPLITRHSPLIARHSPLIARHSPFATDHSPLATDHSPLVARYLRLATTAEVPTGRSGIG